MRAGMLAMLVVMAITVSVALGDVRANVQAFINRVLVKGGVPAGSFVPTLELIDYAEGGLDVYELDGKDNAVIIRGSSGPALTAAVGQYFKKYLKCDVYWELGGGYQMIAFPQEIPIPQTTERQVFLSKQRYYQNTCTASYTFAWRNWTSYEQEIDWMAFHGINLPLAFTGQEFLWQELYRGTFGVSQQGMDQFFTGPGFLAWNRMSNMRAFAGPLPQGWIDQQFSLQKQILQRYKELGIEPVLPAFNGVVPEEMVALYPTANITRLTHAWCDFPSQFCCPYVVSSTDPLFVEIGSTFLKLQRAAYGDLVADAHTYNTDTFNENVPNSNDSSYLASSSSAVFSSMRQGDPAATWLMQAWLFVENPTFWSDDAIAAYLGGVPDDGMLVLDLTSDEVPVWSKLAANKKSFIWCLLHNYGGSRALYGNLTMLAHEPLATLQTPSAGSYFSGTGMTMEAIDQNPLVYEFFTEVGIYGAAEGLPLQKTEEWVQQYAVRRYGLAAPGVSTEQQEAAVAAWSTLLKTSYSGYEPCHHPTCPRRTIITARPLLNMTQETLQAASPLVEVWSNLQRVASSAPLNALGPLRYDLVDVGRQVMSNLFWDVYQLWQASFRRADVDSATALTKTMLSLIADWDSLLLTHEGFLFGRWVGDAKAWARGDETEAEIYLINAKNQVTLWGPKAADLPNLYGYNIDYAAKNWAGLASQYYLPRWQLFLATAAQALQAGASLDSGSPEWEAYTNLEMALGEKFVHDHHAVFSPTPQGDTVATSKLMQSLYGADYASTPASEGRPAKHEYTAVPNSDSLGGLALTPAPTWTRSIPQLQMLCDATPSCLAFSSEGVLRAAASPVVTVSGVTLYVKGPVKA